MGPAPNLSGDAVTASSSTLIEMLIGTGGRSSPRASSSPPHPGPTPARAATVTSNLIRATTPRREPFSLQSRRIPIPLLRNERTLSEPDRLAAAEHLVERVLDAGADVVRHLLHERDVVRGIGPVTLEPDRL